MSRLTFPLTLSISFVYVLAVHEYFDTNSSKLESAITDTKLAADDEADRFGKKDEEV